MKLLMRLYHKYAGNKLVGLLGKIYRNGFFVSNYLSYMRVKRNALKTYDKENPIKVVFLCQYYQAWNKLKSVYELMRKDERFDAVILAVPYDIKNIDDDIFEYFHGLYGENVINAWDGNAWFDIESLKPQYVFYQRPYDSYLPVIYRSSSVSEYAKVCYVSYAYQIDKATEGSCLSKLFYRNVYMYFAENRVYYEYNIKRFKYSHAKGYRKSLDIGYPSLEDFMMKSKLQSEENHNYKVLWTPRWSEDKEVGGSNFIKFKDEVVKLPTELEKVEVVFRPHPMTFQHFISVGKITEKEVNDYLALYEKNERLIYDNKPDYVESFWKGDVLLTDVSSIIVEWFLTAKPVIYCETGCEPNEFLKEMMKVFYVVHNWEEAKKTIEELYAGIDPLKEERKKKVEELMGSDFEHISNRFLETIHQDYLSSIR